MQVYLQPAPGPVAGGPPPGAEVVVGGLPAAVEEQGQPAAAEDVGAVGDAMGVDIAVEEAMEDEATDDEATEDEATEDEATDDELGLVGMATVVVAQSVVVAVS